MLQTRFANGGLRPLSWMFFGLSLALLAAAIRRAFVLDWPTPAPSYKWRPSQVSMPTWADSLPKLDYVAAIERDPFRADRSAPERPFEPGRNTLDSGHTDRIASEAAQQQVRVVGTVVLPDGKGFAICEGMPGRPQLVKLGGNCGVLVLSAVFPGRVILRNERGDRTEVLVPRPGS